MLRWRLASAAVIIAVLVTLVVLDYNRTLDGLPGSWLLPVLLTISAMGAWEMVSLLKVGGYQLRPVLTTALAAFVTLAFFLAGMSDSYRDFVSRDIPPRELPLIAIAISVLIILAGEVRRYSGSGKSIVHAALAVFVVVYIGALFGFVALLRGVSSHEWGMVAVVSMLTITKFADAGAYFCGRALGRRKLAPRLSPGKTIEGAAGGIIAAGAMSWFFFNFIAVWMVELPASVTWPRCVAYGAILAITGMIGDLAESMLKREMRSKDSSSWLPGLGGVLDIIDSVLFAAPAAYLCWVFHLIGP